MVGHMALNHVIGVRIPIPQHPCDPYRRGSGKIISLNKIIVKNKIMDILNRKDEKFTDFFKKYWWIEFLVIIKVLYFVGKGYYGYSIAILFLVGGFIVLWILYRLGLE